MRIKFNFGLFLSVLIGFVWSFFGLVKEKFVFVRDAIFACVARALVLPKIKIPILLSRSQVAMRSYYKKFGRFTGASVVNMNGHFIAKKAVNGIA